MICSIRIAAFRPPYPYIYQIEFVSFIFNEFKTNNLFHFVIATAFMFVPIRPNKRIQLETIPNYKLLVMLILLC